MLCTLLPPPAGFCTPPLTDDSFYAFFLKKIQFQISTSPRRHVFIPSFFPILKEKRKCGALCVCVCVRVLCECV